MEELVWGESRAREHKESVPFHGSPKKVFSKKSQTSAQWYLWIVICFLKSFFFRRKRKVLYVFTWVVTLRDVLYCRIFPCNNPYKPNLSCFEKCTGKDISHHNHASIHDSKQRCSLRLQALTMRPAVFMVTRKVAHLCYQESSAETDTGHACTPAL